MVKYRSTFKHERSPPKLSYYLKSVKIACLCILKCGLKTHIIKAICREKFFIYPSLSHPILPSEKVFSLFFFLSFYMSSCPLGFLLHYRQCKRNVHEHWETEKFRGLTLLQCSLHCSALQLNSINVQDLCVCLQ